MIINSGKKYLTVFLILILFSPAAAKGQNEEDSKKISIFTSILPQKYFVERIGGNRVDVETLVSPGSNPATYEPGPRQVVKLSSADILFTIGVGFENAFLPNIRGSLTGLRIVNTSNGINRRNLEGSVKIIDPHIWLSPALAKKQAETIYLTLVEIDPDGEAMYQSGYNNLIKDLDNLTGELHSVLDPFRGGIIFVFHPAFGYFADEFGLVQKAVETGGKEPSPASLEKIIIDAKAENVKIIFVQPEFSRKSAAAIADAINGVVITLNPLNPDYINNLRNMAAEIKKAFD